MYLGFYQTVYTQGYNIYNRATMLPNMKHYEVVF